MRATTATIATTRMTMGTVRLWVGVSTGSSSSRARIGAASTGLQVTGVAGGGLRAGSGSGRARAAAAPEGVVVAGERGGLARGGVRRRRRGGAFEVVAAGPAPAFEGGRGGFGSVRAGGTGSGAAPSAAGGSMGAAAGFLCG
ncbi:MAG: hypothetical protein R3B70_47600 [Polyangiaceae bacterium]